MIYVILLILIIVVMVVSLRSVSKTKKRIEQNGIVKTGYISKFEVTPTDAGSRTDWYVKYIDENGVERESMLMNGADHYEIGQPIQIKHDTEERFFVMLA